MQRSPWLLCALPLVLATARPAMGEVFLLRNGGWVEGELVNADEKPREFYIIALSNGGQIKLGVAVVDKVQAPRPELAEYEQVRRQYPDTVPGQLQLADWCRDRNLLAQRTIHLQRVLQLDPDQAEARSKLGYRKVKDTWMTQEEEMADKGLVKRDGRWMSPQEAELRDGHDKKRKAELEWAKKIHKWRQLLDGKQGQAEEASKRIRAISDPMAIFALTERLVGKKMDSSPDARLAYVEALARINTHDARGPLAMCAIDDPVEEVRLSVLDELEKQKDEGVTAYFVGRLRDKHASNAMINRAGVGLGRIKDPSCIEALILYLMTVHNEVIQPSGGPGSMTTTFGKNGGGGGLAMNQKPIVIPHVLQNQGVLEALVAITGQNFGYDDRAWKTWYSNQKLKGAPVEARKN